MSLYTSLWNYCTENYNKEYRRALLELLEYNPKASYLDVGCGDGSLTVRCASVIGTGNINALELVEEEIRKCGGKGIICIRHDLDIGNFPFPDNSFDVITANQIIEHLSNTDSLVKDIYRVLRPGGYAVISTNNLATLHWIVLLMLGRQPPTAHVSDEMYKNTDYEALGRGHRRLFTLEGLVKLCKFHSLKVEKSIGSHYFPLPVPLARVACKLDKRHSHCITVKVRK